MLELQIGPPLKNYVKSKYDTNYNRKNKNCKILLQIENPIELTKNSTTSISPMNCKIYPEAIYTSRFINYTDISKYKNDADFGKELEKLIQFISTLSTYKY